MVELLVYNFNTVSMFPKGSQLPADTLGGSYESHTAANCDVAELSGNTDLWFPEGSVRVTIELRLGREILPP